jgi:NTP pyrophosphatase (non-canonical NTP hydrolase)
LNRAWDEIERLRTVNATHRKGWRCQDATEHDALRALMSEVGELAECPISADELADVLTVAMHYVMILDVPRGQIEDLILDKLKVRFSE